MSPPDLDTLLEQLAEQTDNLGVARVRLAELEAARINVAELETAVAETLRLIAEATGVTVGVPVVPVVPALAAGNAIMAAQLKAPPPAPPADDEDEETDEPPPVVEPARTSLFGGQQRRLPPTPPNTRKAPPVLSEGAGDDEPEDDDEDDQVDDEHEGADDEEDEQPAAKRAPTGRQAKPGSLNERIVELLRARGPMKAGDITKALGAQKNPVSGALSYLASKGTLTKAPAFGAPYALAKGAR